ncbi:hypothetical protein [Deinococcus frigens]|uniref:hypothetical protein n=1 Tax=Deinococcus frigens TaxID=249403 RepID=UPI000551EA26|nr:hypothetical protein [Deinococcus frigens]
MFSVPPAFPPVHDLLWSLVLCVCLGAGGRGAKTSPVHPASALSFSGRSAPTLRGAQVRVDILGAGGPWLARTLPPQIATRLHVGPGRAVVQEGRLRRVVVGSASELRHSRAGADLLPIQLFRTLSGAVSDAGNPRTDLSVTLGDQTQTRGLDSHLGGRFARSVPLPTHGAPASPPLCGRADNRSHAQLS